MGVRGDGADRPPPPHVRRTRSAPAPSGSPTATTRRGRSSAGSHGRTRRPSRTPSAGSSRSSAKRAEGHQLTDLALRATGRPSACFPSADERASPSPLPLRDADELPLPLRRRGAAAEEARARVPNRAGPPPALSRPEIVELTKLPYVPVLVDGDEVVNDSRRILQYLDWRYEASASEAAVSAPSTMGSR